MRPTAPSRPATLLAIVIAFVVSAGTTTPAQNNWRRIDTPNFVAIGDVSASVLRDLVIKFEGFRDTLIRLHGPRVIGSAVPTVIIAFPSETAMAPFRPVYNGKPVDVAGLFVPGRDVNYISMITDADKENLRVIFHEYTHSVANNNSRPLPVWLNEGIAEYYSTFEALRNGRDAIIGDVVADHIARLNNTVLIPIADLLTIDHSSSLYNEGSRRSVFYAQSWALVHMILRAEPNRTAQLGAYVDRVFRGDDPVTAWTESFAGINMDKELDQYIRRQSYTAVKYSFGEAMAKFDTTAAPMTPSDVQAFLSDFQVEMDTYDAAAKRLADLAKRDPSSARASVTAARLSIKKNALDEIGDRLRTMAPPTDWFLAYLTGVTLADQASRAVAAPSAADVQAVERMLAVARASGREFPNAVARLAELAVQADAVPSTDISASLERARQLSPAREDFAFLHAQILIRQKELAKSRAILGGLMAGGTPQAKSLARQIMSQVLEYENALAANAAAAAPTMTRVPAGSSPPPPPRSTEPDVARPLFRQTKTGEQRVETTIHNIECVVGKGITFHFKTGDQAITATAMKFDDVEFITYRDDLRGNISCGPYKEPMKVYLTWKPGTVDGSKLAVAIEYLPKDKE